VVLVGGRKDSETYVRSKKKACAEVSTCHHMACCGGNCCIAKPCRRPAQLVCGGASKLELHMMQAHVSIKHMCVIKRMTRCVSMHSRAVAGQRTGSTGSRSVAHQGCLG
jgi:hypothetical protein